MFQIILEELNLVVRQLSIITFYITYSFVLSTLIFLRRVNASKETKDEAEQLFRHTEIMWGIKAETTGRNKEAEVKAACHGSSWIG